MSDGCIRITIIVQVSGYQSTATVWFFEVSSGSVTQKRKAAFLVSPKTTGLKVHAFFSEIRQIVIRMTVGDDQIRPAIKVKVSERRSPAHIGQAALRHTSGSRFHEDIVPEVLIQRVVFVLIIRNQQVEVTIPVNICER